MLEVFFKVMKLADKIHSDNKGGGTGEDSTNNKVWAEDGTVPHRLDGHGEHEGDYGMDGDSDGNDGDSHDKDKDIEAFLLFWGTLKANGEDLIKPFWPLTTVSQDSNIRDQSKIKEKRTCTEVDTYRSDIPE